MSVGVPPVAQAAAPHDERADFVKVSQGAVTSLIRTALATASGLIVTMLMTRALGTGRYGAVALATSIAAMAQMVTGLGLSNGVARMMSFAEARGEHDRVMRLLKGSLILGLPTGMVGAVIVLGLGVTGAIDGFGTSTALVLIAPLVLTTGVRASLWAGLRAWRDLTGIFVIGVATPLFDIAIIGGLFIAGVDTLPPYVIGLVVSTYLDVAITASFVRRGRTIGRLTDTTWVDVKALLSFSVPLIVTELLYFAMRSADVVLLGILRSPEETGLYAPVMRISEAASRGLSAFPVLFVPIATAYIVHKRRESLNELYQSVTKWGYALGFPVILLFVAAPRQILPLLFGEPYGSMDAVARILAIGYWVTLVTGLNGVTLAALGAVRRMAVYSTIGMVMNLSLAFVLIRRFGPAGAAWSTTIAYTFVNLAWSNLLKRMAGIVPLRRDVVKLLAYSWAILGVCTALVAMPALNGTGPAVVVVSAGSAAWLAGLLWWRPFGMRWSEIRSMARRRAAAAPAEVPQDERLD